jgi:hypothetical protein
VLILPPGHEQSVRAKRTYSSREKWMVRVMGTIFAAVIVAVVISLATSGPSSSRGCIYATIPADTGAQQISECGQAARTTCATVDTPGAFTAQASKVVAAECRKARLPVG